MSDTPVCTHTGVIAFERGRARNHTRHTSSPMIHTTHRRGRDCVLTGPYAARMPGISPNEASWPTAITVYTAQHQSQHHGQDATPGTSREL
ncbi:hypothetical protein ACH492_08540 [Streptomyces sp. NPDC019443]|uniref:hypothetical protein n=1 Tax=Streptomyces sp. NPDC019443 TaxID=3365061 RepID=UPI0037920F13